MSVARDTALSAAATLVSISGRLGLAMVFARRLGPDGYGQFVFAQWAIDTLWLVFSFGLPGVLTRFLPQLAEQERGARARHLRAFFALGAGSCLLSVAAVAVVIQLTTGYPPATLLAIMAWALATGMSALATAFLQGEFRYDAILGNSAVSGTVGVVLALALVRENSVEDAAIAAAAALAAGLCMSAVQVTVWCRPGSNTPGGAAPVARSAVFAYGVNVWITALLTSLVWSRGEIAVLRLSLSDADLAVYSVALTISGTVAQGVNLLFGALGPHITHQWASGNIAGVRRLVVSMTRLSLGLATALSALLIGAGDISTKLLFGKEYASSYLPLSILSIAALSVCCGAASFVLQLETNAKFGRNINLAALAILLTLGATLTPALGTAGSAAARAVSQVGIGIVIFVAFSRRSGYRAAGRSLLLSFLACIAFLGFLCIVIHGTPALGIPGSAWPIIAAAGMTLLAYQGIRAWNNFAKGSTGHPHGGQG